MCAAKAAKRSEVCAGGRGGRPGKAAAMASRDGAGAGAAQERRWRVGMGNGGCGRR